MNFKDLLTLKPIITDKLGGLLSKSALIIWYVVLGVTVINLFALLGLLLTFNIGGFLYGLGVLAVYFILGRIACEALGALK